MTRYQSDSPRPGDGPIEVLLIDDQRFIGMAVARLLAGEPDLKLHCCYAATEAIAQANQIAPTVIFQDLMMPGIDGLTLVGLFRANPQTAATPIIVLSGNDDAASRARAAAAGADDYLVKLPDKRTLVACIRRHASGEPGTRTAGAVPPLDAADVTFDRAMVGALRDAAGAQGAELVTTLIRQFLEEATSLMNDLTQAAHLQDATALKAASHSLKGTALTIGARRLGALAGQIEDHADRRPEVRVEAVLLATIADELGRVRADALLETQATT